MTEEIEGKTIVVWFSCGAASAVAAKKILEKYGEKNHVRIVNNPIANEDSDNRRFLRDVEQWLGVEIESAFNSNYPSADINDVFRKRKYISGVKGAPCTQELKKEARYQYEQRVHIDYHVLGFTYDEISRSDQFIKFERANVIPILIDEMITKGNCFTILKEVGIALPRIYLLGAPNANCVGCVKATSPTYWNWVRVQFPEIFQERAVLSREIGCRLVRVKGKRLFLDELPETATGHKMKSLPECGIFCELPKILK